MEDELIELRGKLEITELFVQQVKSIHALVIKLYLHCLIKCVVCFFHIPAHMNQLCSSSPVPAATILLPSQFVRICFWCFLVALYNPLCMSVYVLFSYLISCPCFLLP